MSVDIDIQALTKAKHYGLERCYPKMSADTVFLTAAMIGILNSFDSLQESGHRVDQDNQRLYVLMRGNKLAVIGVNDGFPYEVARLSLAELKALNAVEQGETV